MRSTFKILFYANKGKEKDGIVRYYESRLCPCRGRVQKADAEEEKKTWS